MKLEKGRNALPTTLSQFFFYFLLSFLASSELTAPPPYRVVVRTQRGRNRALNYSELFVINM